MQKLIVTAIVAGLLSLCSALVLLFSGDGVKAFADISQVQYAVAIITAIATALGIVKAGLTETPASVEQAQLNKMGGFARPQLLTVLFVLSIAVTFLPGCAAQKVTPEKLIASASLSIEQIGLQIDAAQKSGQISNEREDHYIDELKKINADLRTAVSLTGDSKAQSLDDINARLIELRAQLAKEQAR